MESKEFEIDHDMVSPAIINLLEISIDACVDDQSKKEAYKITFRVKEDNDYITFKIKDNGTGIDEATQNKMFTLFFSPKGYRRAGLGLFVSKNVIDQHKGTIEVNSTPGEGICFSIKLTKIPQNNNNHHIIK